ncbi:MAG TPA: chemotaxis protein CheA [Aliiroseovarius sp.]|nr:chemotaxis protein CheA [Aliiroseovarius sp.]
MTDPMAEIRASFFVECEELLEAMQDGLQMMEEGDGDVETVNIVFRAVHSIKGGAGAFGLDDLVAFAHKFETAMDEVRSGNLTPDQEVMKLLFLCGDVLADLVRESREEIAHDPARSEPVLKKLAALIGDAEEEEQDIDFEPAALSLDLDIGLDIDGSESGLTLDPPAADPEYLVEFEPETSLYTSGNEPLYLFRAARDLGPLRVKCKSPDLPALADLDPEQSHLSWELILSTTEGEDAIKEVFDFVDGLCSLNISAKTPATPELPEIPDLPALTPDTPPPAEQQALAEPVQPASDAVPPPPKANTEKAPSPKPASKPAPKPNAASMPRATVRVDLDRIDRLVNLVGEIVINQSMLSQSVEEAGIPANSAVRTGLEEFLQLTRDIQESVMMIRAQPVKSLFQRMARIVREASAAIDKDVRLQTEGENTEIDKTVIERLADPLTHMIRNAVDHGLEDNEDRAKLGKEPQGKITLTAAHRSGRVVIEVIDDGAGINREKVRDIAVNKGLIPEDQTLSDSEIDNLLFLPGFSTASEVSNLSGRGVGMDVVRSAIQSLGGRIVITSERGKGTTFSISLPLTLAVLDGMVVRIADETIVVPLNSIMETLALNDEEIRELGPETHVVNIRDTFVPLLDLGAELGYRDPIGDYSGSVILLIAQEDGSRAALAVDSIEDQRQVVIKGLQDSYGHVPGIAAATILGDGQIALILDPVDLIAQASGQTRISKHQAQKAG